MSSSKAFLSMSGLANSPYTPRDGTPWAVFCPQSTMATAFTQMLFGFGVVGVQTPPAYPVGSMLCSLLCRSVPGLVVVADRGVLDDVCVVTVVVVDSATGL